MNGVYSYLMLRLTQDIGHAARLVSLSFFLWSIGEGMWLYIQPVYLERLGATPFETGIALALGSFGRLVTALPLIFLINRYNPRWLMLPGWLTGVVSMVVLALANHWIIASIGLTLYGFASTVLVPANAYLVQAHHHDSSKNPRASLGVLFAYSWAAASAGLIISPAIGGWLGEAFGLRSVFAVAAFWFVLSTLVIYLTPHYPHEIASDVPSGNVWQNRRFRRLQISFGLVFVAGPLGYGLVPRFLEEFHHYSTDALGFLGALTSIGATVWSLVLGQRTHGFGLGVALLVISFGIFWVTQAFGAMAVAYFLYGTWIALRPVATRMAAEAVSSGQQGIAFVMIDVLYGVTGILAPLMAGWLYGFDPLYPFVAALILLGVLLLNFPLRVTTN